MRLITLHGYIERALDTLPLYEGWGGLVAQFPKGWFTAGAWRRGAGARTPLTFCPIFILWSCCQIVSTSRDGDGAVKGPSLPVFHPNKYFSATLPRAPAYNVLWIRRGFTYAGKDFFVD